MMIAKVLFVEDEPALSEIVSESLTAKGFEVVHVYSLKDAFERYYASKPDILLIDVMLPDGDGFSFARQIRTNDLDTPIIFLTSKSLASDVVMGFESGGSDYLKKPFSMEELIIRMKVLLSKNRLVLKKDDDFGLITLGKYKFFYPNGELYFLGSKRVLTSRESEILKMLIINKNRVLDRNSLLMAIWGQNDYFTGRSLDVFMTKLRKYLKEDEEIFIVNIRGQGYKLIIISPMPDRNLQ